MNSGQYVEELPLIIAAAHELKAPLALIRQLALNLESMPGGLDEATLLKQITLTSERALRLTTDLTRTHRLEDSLFSCEPINSRQLCEEVAHELTPLFKARQRELQVKGGGRQTMVIANRDLLRRIVMNFADNALHYTDTDNPVLIQTSTSAAHERVRIAVRDYGPAVPTDVWRRVRGHLGTSPQALQNRPASSGLGLYIAGQFAEAMHGSIGAIRHRDGASFYVDVLASRQMKLL